MTTFTSLHSVSIIGAGNVGSHLTKIFKQKGVQIDCVYSRSIRNAESLAKEVGTLAIDQFDLLPQESDLYVICVPDDSIMEVADKLFGVIPRKSIVAHTSGSRPLSDLAMFQNRAVFYPLQTFSKGDTINFDEVPILIHTSKEELSFGVFDLAQKISSRVLQCDDELRGGIHLAAVLSCNFVNHLIYQAEEHLKRSEIDGEILYPLIKKTINKALNQSTFNAQTGPARRKDHETIKKHLQELKYKPSLRKVYKWMSRSIIKTYSQIKD